MSWGDANMEVGDIDVGGINNTKLSYYSTWHSSTHRTCAPDLLKQNKTLNSMKTIFFTHATSCFPHLPWYTQQMNSTVANRSLYCLLDEKKAHAAACQSFTLATVRVAPILPEMVTMKSRGLPLYSFVFVRTSPKAYQFILPHKRVRQTSHQCVQ